MRISDGNVNSLVVVEGRIGQLPLGKFIFNQVNFTFGKIFNSKFIRNAFKST